MKVVTLSCEKYWPGTLALAWSLKKNAGFKTLDFTILMDETIKSESLDQLRAFMDFELIKTQDLGHFNYRGTLGKARYALALQKLLILNLPDEDKRYYIDSDIVCLRSLKEAEMFTHLTATIEYGNELGASAQGRPGFSAGSFVFRPDRSLLEEIQEFTMREVRDWPLADQSILNEFFWSTYPDDVHLMGIEWETLKRVAVKHPKAWGKISPRLLHFVGDKPWLTNEKGYQDIDAIWHELYAEASKKRNPVFSVSVPPQDPEPATAPPPAIETAEPLDVVAKSFAEFVEGKSVALVAPGAHLMGSLQREKIEGYDLVARVNRGFPVPDAMIEDIGAKTDIVYHLMNVGIGISEKEFRQCLGVVSFIISVHHAGSPRISHFKKMNRGRMKFECIEFALRQSVSSRIRQSPNAGVMAITHLLSLPIKELYLTGFNFYQAGYYTGYGGRSAESAARIKTGTGHDQHSQKSFIKDLISKAKIPVSMDETLSSILENHKNTHTSLKLLQNLKDEDHVKLRALMAQRQNGQMVLIGDTMIRAKQDADILIRKGRAVMV